MHFRCSSYFDVIKQTDVMKIRLLLFFLVAGLNLVAQQAEISDYLILFDQKVDLSGADAIMRKEDKGSYVFNRLFEHARLTQRDVRSLLDLEGYDYQSFCVSNVIRVRAEESSLRKLLAREKSIQIFPDWRFKVPEDRMDPVTYSSRSTEPLPWGLTLVGADKVWDLGFKGQNVVVGGHDTGVEWQHPALKENYRGWLGGSVDHNFNWHDAIHAISPLHQDSMITEVTNPCGLSISQPCDDISSSHGTHTMGTMVGYDPASNLTIGVAPEARWIAVRNMERGFGTLSSYLEGFEWFLAPTDTNGLHPDPTRAPDVINNSWACIEDEGCNPGNFEILRIAVENLRKAGIMVVVSAGNSGAAGCGSVSTPAAIFDASLTVGSIDSTDTISSFSSRGPVTVDGSFRTKPDVTAPGRHVLSCTRGGKYGYLTGTSMAGPHVAGLVALLISANPELSGQVDVIEKIILDSAIKKTDSGECQQGDPMPEGGNNLYGFGRIDALKAVLEAINYTTPVKENRKDEEWKVFPNPASQQITIENEILQKFELNIYDLTGRKIFWAKLDTNAMDLNTSLWPGGIYVIEIAGVSGSTFRKLVQVIH